jgi:DNA-binding transcriptional MerR regulator
MEQVFQIGEIANFFGIPASTLRYWEESGVIVSRKNPENQYRQYTVADLMTISDILFYKSLGIPLKQIRSMEQMELQSQQDICAQQMETLRQQEIALKNRKQKLQYHITALDTVRKLQSSPYQETDIDTDCIVPFELIEIEKLKQYINNPYLYSRVQHSTDIKTERRGLSITFQQRLMEKYNDTLWEKQSEHYVVCLMKEEIAPDYPNNLAEHLEVIQKQYQTGYVISRFLTCAQENGKTFDFYKTYIEVLK